MSLQKLGGVPIVVYACTRGGAANALGAICTCKGGGAAHYSIHLYKGVCLHIAVHMYKGVCLHIAVHMYKGVGLHIAVHMYKGVGLHIAYTHVQGGGAVESMYVPVHP